ncbi:DUF427 domain-containing protein [Phyllobacterium sp. 21LDTY02-6]|uniref:DUF427 domain-containing protein n=1 Tax=unclassified Phyllobacterium TaxID=2638441 RepID=UPI002020532E|nr:MULTISPECIES: DUF427 domain-containing protein [unclassified Phyllobacterium]MCO4318409.1 DUF427 domain-containing protein [Phyllobacterium sp. 21LDTY02-6]MCX8281329.1 DUF427 domain-containing protein [Phyllobacterium sp. 0TCS1.6C]MCX8296015.1 DUF427 domain-containing protein [Phyllobacterium sp. 0TCS1.6A]
MDDGGITIRPYPESVTVRFRDVVIASSDKALELREPGHDPVLYIPFDDIYFTHLEKTSTETKCPWKGTATYWRINGQGESADDAMWAYEEPKAEVAQIAGHGAFDPKHVVFEGVIDAEQVLR